MTELRAGGGELALASFWLGIAGWMVVLGTGGAYMLASRKSAPC
jgi:hypothetical protein